MTDAEAAGKRRGTWVTILIVLGGTVGIYLAQEAEAEKHNPPPMPCIYNPNTGEPAFTPCAK